MRWFKHLSSSQDDEVMSELIDEFGPAGYGVWWIILEKIALSCGENDEINARYSAKRWSNFAGCSAQYFRKIVRFLDEKIPNFCVEDDGRYIQIHCPNILKYRDEYTQKKQRKQKKDSGHTPDPMSGSTPDNVSREQRQTQSTETEGEQSTEENGPSGPGPYPNKRNPADPYVCAIPTQAEGKPLKILKSQADKWQQQFQYIDVYGELGGLEEWAKNNPEKRWKQSGCFMACASRLTKTNREAMIECHKKDPHFDPNDPTGDKAARADWEATQAMINRTTANRSVGGTA